MKTDPSARRSTRASSSTTATGYIMEYAIAHAYVDARFWRLHEPEDEALLDAVADAVLD